MRKIVAASLGLGLALAGCAHIYAPGPGMSATELQPDAARCRLAARGMQRDYSFGAYGSPKFVAISTASASLAYGIGSAIEQDQNFDDCMQARGWRPVSTQQQTQAAQTQTTITQAKAELIGCRQAVAAKPEYAIVIRHMSIDGSHTLAQLTDETLPTAEEARAVQSSFDETDACATKFIATVGTIQPSLVPLMQAARDDATARAALLVGRKITWAESARRSQASQQAFQQQVSQRPSSATAQRRSFGAQAMDGRQGVVLLSVDTSGAAWQAGLRDGDEIVAFNDSTVTRQADIQAALAGITAGSDVRVTYLRDGTEKTATIVF